MNDFYPLFFISTKQNQNGFQPKPQKTTRQSKMFRHFYYHFAPAVIKSSFCLKIFIKTFLIHQIQNLGIYRCYINILMFSSNFRWIKEILLDICNDRTGQQNKDIAKFDRNFVSVFIDVLK